MNKRMAKLACVVLVVVGLSGCYEAIGFDENEINIAETIKGEWFAYGKIYNEYTDEWIDKTYWFTFYEDGKTFKHSLGVYYIGTYYVVGDTLECYYESRNNANYWDNYYKIEMPDENTLILTTIGDGEMTHDETDGAFEYIRVV